MRQTENYKNVKRVGKKLAPQSGRSSRFGDREQEQEQAGGSIARKVVGDLGLAQLLGPFAPQVENFIVDNVESWTEKLGDINDITAKARKYAREYPVIAVVGGAAIGIAAALVLVNSASLMTASSRRS